MGVMEAIAVALLGMAVAPLVAAGFALLAPLDGEGGEFWRRYEAYREREIG